MAHIEDLWVRQDKTRKPNYGEGMRWRAVWTDGTGKRHRKTFDKKDQAKAHLTAIDHQQRSGEYVTPVVAARTLGDYWPRLERIKSGSAKSTRVMYDNAWKNHVEPVWGHVKVRDVRGPAVSEWLAGLTRKNSTIPLSASAKDKVKITLSSLCELALDDGVIQRNPIDKVKVNAGRTKERRYLTVAQADALADAMKPHDLVIWTLIYTGIRRGEVAGLKGRDLDVRRRRLRISRDIDTDGLEDDTKSGRHRDVPVPETILGRLQEAAQAAGPDGWLFPSPKGKPWTRDSWRPLWERNRAASGYVDLDTHELRHTAVAWAIRSGADVKTIQRMVGHASAATTLDIYAHLWDEGLDQLSDRVAALVESERAQQPLTSP